VLCLLALEQGQWPEAQAVLAGREILEMVPVQLVGCLQEQEAIQPLHGLQSLAT